MNKKVVFLILLCYLSCQSLFADSRKKYNFNPEWKVFVGDNADAYREGFDDSGWKKVTLPYAWNEDEAFRESIHTMTTGVAWYRKTFVIPENEKGKKVFLEFEGVRQLGEIFVNGRKLFMHENGVMAFGVDITDVVRFGENNIVSVRTDNRWDYKEQAANTSFQWHNGNFNVNYGGIPKNVILHITSQVYQTLPLLNGLGTTGVYIYATNMDISKASAVINAESEVKNESGGNITVSYSVIVEDMEGKNIAEFSGGRTTLKSGETTKVKASKKLSGLNFWSWGYGYLYNVRTILKIDNKPVDIVTTRTGFRKTKFGNGMIWLNDRVIQIKGYGQRTSNEWPAIGLSVPAWLSDYSNRLVIEGNGNTIRWMHVTPWKQDVESCDRVGLIHAMPAGDAERDVVGRQWEQRKELMADAIVYNRNNPSILFYECGNESISYEHMAEMKEIRDKYDPYGGRAIGSREMLDIDNAEYGGEMLYINKSAKHPMWATEYNRNEALRKYWDEHSYPYHKEGGGPLYNNANASAYNQNQDMFAIEDIRRWYDYFRERPGTGTRVSSGGVNIIFSESNTHYRGAENYRRSGEVDAMRIPKDAYYAHQVMWDGWVDLDNYHTHIIGHWSYEGRGTKKDIYVVSAAPDVELFLNGESLGKGEKSYHFLNTFRNIDFKAGTLKAVSRDENGNELSSHTLETAGKPAAIRMNSMISPNGMLADGHDLALLEFEIVDIQGRRCPLANNWVDFKVEGPAEWRGGIGQGTDNFILAKQLPAECGVNRVLVRSTTTSGKITITATSGTLTPATVSFDTKPVAVNGGLRIDFPGQMLPSYIGRGPTPTTPSYKVSRIAIDIASATASSNEETIKNSYDDNELSHWVSDSAAVNHWITYNFIKETEISQVCLKFRNFNNINAPITILVDDNVAWQGVIERSLGYVTVAFEPVTGKSVTIKLSGETTSGEKFGNLVELSEEAQARKQQTRQIQGQANATRGSGNRQLAITEIEFYKAAN